MAEREPWYTAGGNVKMTYLWKIMHGLLKKIENRTAICISKPYSGYISKDDEISILKGYSMYFFSTQIHIHHFIPY
jgi:hypothetical protein